MKILYVLNSTNIYGGSTKSFLRYLEDLLKRHTDIQAIICASSNLPEKSTNHLKIKTYSIPIIFNIYPASKTLKDKFLFLPKLLYKAFVNHSSYKSIYKIAKKEKVDIIHTNVGVVNCGYLAARKLGIPHVYHLREYQTSDFGMKIMPSFNTFIDSLKSKNNYNICITYGIQNHFNLNESNSKVIYNGVKHFSYNPAVVEKDKYFLFVGRLEESKGIRDVINVFCSFAERNYDYNLLIAGDTNNYAYKRELKDKVSSMGLNDRIHFLGNRKDIDNLMQKATAIIVSSSKEAFGLISAEAAFNKCLIIGKNTGGTAEQIENGIKLFRKEAGIRYQTNDELLQILIAISQGEDYGNVIDTAYRCATTLYSIETCSDSIYKLYSSILNHHYND